jgi:hypothetical protein
VFICIYGFTFMYLFFIFSQGRSLFCARHLTRNFLCRITMRLHSVFFVGWCLPRIGMKYVYLQYVAAAAYLYDVHRWCFFFFYYFLLLEVTIISSGTRPECFTHQIKLLWLLWKVILWLDVFRHQSSVFTPRLHFLRTSSMMGVDRP